VSKKHCILRPFLAEAKEVKQLVEAARRPVVLEWVGGRGAEKRPPKGAVFCRLFTGNVLQSQIETYAVI
jgi:hypothetical protein